AADVLVVADRRARRDRGVIPPVVLDQLAPKLLERRQVRGLAVDDRAGLGVRAIEFGAQVHLQEVVSRVPEGEVFEGVGRELVAGRIAVLVLRAAGDPGVPAVALGLGAWRKAGEGDLAGARVA